MAQREEYCNAKPISDSTNIDKNNTIYLGEPAVPKLPPIQDILDKSRIAYTLSRSGRNALFCRDPDGNALEILQLIK